MKFDKYTTRARLFPSIIVLLPFLIFTIYCDIEGLKETFDNLLQIKIIGNITISIVLLFLLMQLNRSLGKFLFESYLFKKELDMPTSRFLLYSNGEFSREYKIQIRNAFNDEFNSTMPTEQDEINDLENTKKRIVEAVGLIRQKVKDGRLLLQHNIEYGFARNLIGGSILAFLMSIFDVIYFYKIGNYLIGWISAILAFGFFILLIFHKGVITNLGNQYAKRLFQEYLQS